MALDKLGRYEIKKELERGGMVTVHSLGVRAVAEHARSGSSAPLIVKQTSLV